LGSARAVNRRYISDRVPLKIRLQASAGFVSASALGMACGPALAGLLQVKFKIYSLTFNQSTLPGWIMAVLWLLYLIWLWIAFKEPARDNMGDHDTSQNNSTGMALSVVLHMIVQNTDYICYQLKLDTWLNSK
jgi:MFS family permease